MESTIENDKNNEKVKDSFKDIHVSVENYIWMLERTLHIKINRDKFIECSSVHDVLGKLLVNQYNKDTAERLYINRSDNVKHGKSINGELLIQECLDKLAILNGKILGDVYYSDVVYSLNIEVMSAIKRAVRILLSDKKAFNDENILNSVKKIPLTLNFGRPLDINIEILCKKYKNTRLESILLICKIIENSISRVKDDNESTDKNDSMDKSIRHLVEQILRQELNKRIKLKDTTIGSKTFSGGTTTCGSKTDITIASKYCTIIEVKTGELKGDNREKWVHQTKSYMFDHIDNKGSNLKYSKNEVNGIVLSLEGQIKDVKEAPNIMQFASMNNIIKLDESGRCSVISIDMQSPDTSILENQIKHLANLIVDYNK